MGRTSISLAPRFEGIDRFTTLYTVSEVARYLDVPVSTFSTWAGGYPRHPKGRPDVSQPAVVTAVDGQRRGAHDPSVPFIGLAEGLLLAAMRRCAAPYRGLSLPCGFSPRGLDWNTRLLPELSTLLARRFCMTMRSVRAIRRRLVARGS